MVRKKKQNPSRFPPPPPPPPLPPSPPTAAVMKEAIEEGLERAKNELRRGSHREAVQIIKHLRDRFAFHPDGEYLLLRAEALVFIAAATESSAEPETKRRYGRNAVDASRRLVEAKPDAIDLAVLRVEVLCRYAAAEGLRSNDAQQECLRGLRIRNPVVLVASYGGREKMVADMQRRLKKSLYACLGTYSSDSEDDAKEDPVIRAMRECLGTFQAAVDTARTILHDLPPHHGLLEEPSKASDEDLEEDVTFWMRSMTPEERKGFFEVSVEELRTHLASLDLPVELSCSVSKDLSEALSWPDAHKGEWEIWACQKCDEKLADSDSYWRHMELLHQDQLPENLKHLQPVEVDRELATTLLDGNWKPIDVPVLVDIIHENRQLQAQSNETSDDFCPKSAIYPQSTDSVRAGLLDNIRWILQQLLEHDCLFETHFEWILEPVVKVVHDITCGPEFMRNLALYKSFPLCLPFLHHSILIEIHDLLNKLSYVENPQRLTEENNSAAEDVNCGRKCQPEFVLSCDSSSIILQYKIIRTASISDDAEGDYMERVDVRDIFQWLHLGSSVEEKLITWYVTRQHKQEKGMELLRELSEVLHTLKASCERKHELLSCQEALYKAQSCADEASQIEKDELIEVDTNLVRSVIEIRDLKRSIGQLSALDHYDVIMPLIQSLLKAHLVELREKDAIKMYTAAEEAFLKVLGLNRFKNIEDIGDHSKQALGKAKSKTDRRPKDIEAPNSPAFSSTDQNISCQAHKGKLLVENEPRSFSVDYLKHVERQLGQRAVLNGGKRNLEEALEGQSNAESCGKHFKMASGTLSGNMSGTLGKKEIPVGIGLRNEFGANNCFLNVIIQSLWHLRRFRGMLMGSSLHKCVGDPCVVCALFTVFKELKSASMACENLPVNAACLRQALSCFYSEKKFFQTWKKDVASDLLEALLNCLHMSSGSSSVESNTLQGCSCICIAHTIFGIYITEKMECSHCGAPPKSSMCYSFFKNVVASDLIESKKNKVDRPFHELVKLALMYSWSCDAGEDGGECGKRNHIQLTLSTLPHVFTLVLDWQHDDIPKTLESITTELDLGFIFEGVEHGTAYLLVSVVCFHGCHYVCFALSHEHRKWFKYDDEDIEEIGDWDAMYTTWISGCWQPSVLCFESAI